MADDGCRVNLVVANLGRSVADLITVTANFTKIDVKWLMIAMEFANLVRSAVDLIADDGCRVNLVVTSHLSRSAAEFIADTVR